MNIKLLLVLRQYAARRARGRADGGAVEGSVVDVVWVAGSAVAGGGGASAGGGARAAGGAVANGGAGGVVDVVWAAGSAVVGGTVTGGCGASMEGRARAAGGTVADGGCTQDGDSGLWIVRERCQHSETRGGFLLSGEVFVRKLPLAGARRWKGDALAAAARHCFFEVGGGELARGGGEGGGGGRGCSSMRQKTADWARQRPGTPRTLTTMSWWSWKRGIAQSMEGGRTRASQLGFRFQAPLRSRRQGAVPFPKKVQGRFVSSAALTFSSAKILVTMSLWDETFTQSTVLASPENPGRLRFRPPPSPPVPLIVRHSVPQPDKYLRTCWQPQVKAQLGAQVSPAVGGDDLSGDGEGERLRVVYQFDTDSQATGDGLLEMVGVWTVLLRIEYYGGGIRFRIRLLSEPNFFRHGDTYGGETGSLVEPDAFRHGGTYGGASRAGLFDAAIPTARLGRWSSWIPLDKVDTYSGEAGSLAPRPYTVITMVARLFAGSAIIPPVGHNFGFLGDLSFSSGVYLVTCGRRERTGIFPSTSGVDPSDPTNNSRSRPVSTGTDDICDPQNNTGGFLVAVGGISHLISPFPTDYVESPPESPFGAAHQDRHPYETLPALEEHRQEFPCQALSEPDRWIF
ncbi:hypothetical protein DFH08DRAFT_945297 [Mycena albidolilacea]|uniref:Uncharacterized protein n=1 Tax=Mycena albidolilacea TaxID=1033008 RepID=A0AAD7E9R5_9AGAR|nr:hypothetical protein DFH08DRAFT_945297 [Mycena albidolilacea]